MNNTDYLIFKDTQQEVNLEIMTEFEKDGIEFAFPTRTILLEPAEKTIDQLATAASSWQTKSDYIIKTAWNAEDTIQLTSISRLKQVYQNLSKES